MRSKTLNQELRMSKILHCCLNVYTLHNSLQYNSQVMSCWVHQILVLQHKSFPVCSKQMLQVVHLIYLHTFLSYLARESMVFLLLQLNQVMLSSLTGWCNDSTSLQMNCQLWVKSTSQATSEVACVHYVLLWPVVLTCDTHAVCAWMTQCHKKVIYSLPLAS